MNHSANCFCKMCNTKVLIAEPVLLAEKVKTEATIETVESIEYTGQYWRVVIKGEYLTVKKDNYFRYYPIDEWNNLCKKQEQIDQVARLKDRSDNRLDFLRGEIKHIKSIKGHKEHPLTFYEGKLEGLKMALANIEDIFK